MLDQLRIEILALCRQPFFFITMVFSALTLFLLLHFGIPHAVDQASVLPALSLGTLVITLTTLAQQAFQNDQQTGRIAHWRYAPLTCGWIIVCKCISYLICAALPLCLTFSGFMTLSIEGHHTHSFAYQLSIMLFCAASVIATTLFSAAIGTLFGNIQSFTTMMTLPFIFSGIIFAADALAIKDTTSNASTLLVIYTLCIIPLCCWLAAKAIRMSH